MIDGALVLLASFFAGMVDAIVGGGGLILVPALFAVYPSTHPATLFGINKSASIWGTSLAAWQFSRRVPLRWRSLWAAVAAGFVGAFAGAWTVTLISPQFLRQALPLVLLAVLVYTLWNRQLGRVHAPRLSPRGESWSAAAIGALIGFYDGFFGPGAGSFLVFAFVRLLGYDFLNASVQAKFVNVATNLAAVILFAAKGHVWWQLGLTLALANVLGSLLGARLALRHGAGFVRVAFILVVTALICKTGWDALTRG